MTTTRRTLLGAGAGLIGGFMAGGALAAEQRLTDMAGKSVAMPDPIRRLATFGPVPVLNSFIFAFRDQGLIVNGLPENFARSPRWKYQPVFAPGLQSRPILQGAGNILLSDRIVQARPDLVLTMSTDVVHALDGLRIPCLQLVWDKPDDVKALMTLLGQVLHKPAVAGEYGAYFDSTVARVDGLTGKLAADRRPRVLYCDLQRLTQPHLIAEWWIPRAGGISVTDNGRRAQSITFSLEQMLAWNPEVISDARQVPLAYGDPRFSSISAVRNKRVHVAPSGAHLWANRTVEEPLTILWAATILHPDLTRSIDIRKEARDFYARFFGVTLQPDQINEILRGVEAE